MRSSVLPASKKTARSGRPAAAGVVLASEAFQVGDQIDQLAGREAVAIVGHDRASVRASIARRLDDHGVRIDDRLEEIAGRMVVADVAQRGPDLRGPRELLAGHRVTRVALEPREDLTALGGVTLRRSQHPALRHAAT